MRSKTPLRICHKILFKIFPYIPSGISFWISTAIVILWTYRKFFSWKMVFLKFIPRYLQHRFSRCFPQDLTGISSPGFSYKEFCRVSREVLPEKLVKKSLQDLREQLPKRNTQNRITGHFMEGNPGKTMWIIPGKYLEKSQEGHCKFFKSLRRKAWRNLWK